MPLRFSSRYLILGAMSILVVGLAAACQPSPAPAPAAAPGLAVLAAESFIADMAQNVAGGRLRVETLIPLGLDPHAFEPTPQDVARIADSQVLIVNGAGFEEWLQEALDNSGGDRQVVDASGGLASRETRTGEEAVVSGEEQHHDVVDPHFWLDPTLAIAYVENIRNGLSQADPAGKEVYAQNAAVYIAQLRELDSWIGEQVQAVPAERRRIVTNHESFGYFADRYGFAVVGTVVPSVSSGASPSAQQLALLVEQIRATGAPAIFLETGANAQLAEQVARETGVKVVSDLYSHSLTLPDGPAPTYIDMMRHNTQAIVDALR